MDFHDHMQNQIQNNMQNNMPIYVRPIPQKENGMSTAAMTTGIIGAVSILTFPFFPFLPFLLAGVSITLAFLSRGRNRKLSAHAKAGFITSVCSLAVICLFFVLMICLIINSDDYKQEFVDEFNKSYEEIYGEPFEFDLSDESFPTDMR